MTTIGRRSRLITAVSLAFALSGAALPSVATAQEGPEAPVLGVLQAISEKRFAELSQYFCPEFAEQAADLDLGAAIAGSLPAGVDPQIASDALQFSVTGPDGQGEPLVTVVSEDATGTTLQVEATLTAGLDPEASEPFIRALVVAQLEAAGMEVSDENIAAFMTLVEGQLEGQGMFSQEISTTLIVTQEADGRWLICSPLQQVAASPGAAASPGVAATAAPVQPATPADASPSAPPA